jgi:hypothetical protein
VTALNDWKITVVFRDINSNPDSSKTMTFCPKIISGACVVDNQPVSSPTIYFMDSGVGGFTHWMGDEKHLTYGIDLIHYCHTSSTCDHISQITIGTDPTTAPKQYKCLVNPGDPTDGKCNIYLTHE